MGHSIKVLRFIIQDSQVEYLTSRRPQWATIKVWIRISYLHYLSFLKSILVFPAGKFFETLLSDFIK